MNAISIRLLNQQLAAPQFTSPAEVVAHMGAMQAQEYRMMRWAVEMRTKRPSHESFRRAFDSGEIVRLHLMRGTWQLLAREDYYPYLQLCGQKAKQVIMGWMSASKITLSDDEKALVRSILLDTTAKAGSATKEDFTAALADRDIHMEDHRLSYHIRMAELAGELCSGDLLPMKATYALAEEKIGSRKEGNRDEILLRLTRTYFKSRQPATLEDFVWWSGLSMSDCRRGIQLIGTELHQERWKDYTFYLTDDCRTRGYRAGQALFIPPYDEYLIAYKSRDVVLPQEHRHHAHNQSGIFQPIIATDGIITGNWAPFKQDPAVTFFGQAPEPIAIQREWDRYRNYLKK